MSARNCFGFSKKAATFVAVGGLRCLVKAGSASRRPNSGLKRGWSAAASRWGTTFWRNALD